MNQNHEPGQEPQSVRRLRSRIGLVAFAVNVAVLVCAKFGNPVYAILGVVGIVFAVLLLAVASKAAHSVDSGRGKFWDVFGKSLACFVALYACFILVVAAYPLTLYILKLASNPSGNHSEPPVVSVTNLVNPTFVANVTPVIKPLPSPVVDHPMTNKTAELAEESALQLLDVSIVGDELSIVWRNWTSGCAQLRDATTHDPIGNRNIFCDSGARISKTKMDHVISPGDLVELCVERRDSLLCAEPKVVTGVVRRAELLLAELQEDGLRVVFSKNFETCLHLVDEQGNTLRQNLCTTDADGRGDMFIPAPVLLHPPASRPAVTTFEPLPLRAGTRVKLQHGNNARFCSDFVAVSNRSPAAVALETAGLRAGN